MRKYCYLLLLFVVIGCKNDKSELSIISSDINNFWIAYDKIRSTEDTIQQNTYLQELFIEKGSIGQKAMIDARGYSNNEYLDAIRNYPEFWSSIRENTNKVNNYSKELEEGIERLRAVYPDLKDSKIYFTIGALRSGGTTMDSLVLIGSEIALADKTTPSFEFPEQLSHLVPYFENNPKENIIFLNIHEYVHTQQKTTIGKTLLAQTLIEGVAEFVATRALETNSPNPQIKFGKEHNERIKSEFSKEMFSPYLHNWIWNSPNNKFGMRDLAYYVGYAICEKYYHQEPNKDLAIKKMMELDFDNERDLIEFVNHSKYFGEPLDIYKKEFEESRPEVTTVEPFHKKSKDISPDIESLTIHFSDSMDTRFRNFEIGPLGKEHLIRFKEFHGFSKDKTALHFNIEPLEAAKTYQIIVGSGFRNSQGIPLKPYLIEFTTIKPSTSDSN